MRDLCLVDRTIVVKGQSKQERPARRTRGKFACARELQADGFPVHARCLGQIRRVTEYAMLRIGSGGIDLGRCQAFPPQTELKTGIEILGPYRGCEYANWPLSLWVCADLGQLLNRAHTQGMIQRSAGQRSAGMAVSLPVLFAS